MKRFLVPLLLPCALASAAPDGVLRTAREVNEFLERGHGKTNYVLSVQVINDPADTAMIVRDETGRTAVPNQNPVAGLRKGDLLEIRGFARRAGVGVAARRGDVPVGRGCGCGGGKGDGCEQVPGGVHRVFLMGGGGKRLRGESYHARERAGNYTTV